MRTPDAPRGSSALLAVVVIVAATLAGCGKAVELLAPAAESVSASGLRAQPAADDGLAANLFYPLQLGNHWRYNRTSTVVVLPTAGPPVNYESRGMRDRDLVCVEPRAGHSYIVERTFAYTATHSWTWWVWYRQDEGGLYEADVAVPPACAAGAGRRVFDAEAVAPVPKEEAWAAVATKLTNVATRPAYRAAWERVQSRVSAIRQAVGGDPGAGPRTVARGGGVGSDEITRLQYPLHPGARWLIRTDPRIESTVEGMEVLDLPVGPVPAWRIRIDWDDFGPEDRVHVWFGRSGYLKLFAHFEDVATNEQGNPIGRLIAEDDERLVDLSLDRGRFATP